MRALSIRQPYAELIPQGRKRIEYRTTNVKTMLDKPFYIYAAKRELPVVSCQKRRRRSSGRMTWRSPRPSAVSILLDG
jgi:hypothetical protein